MLVFSIQNTKMMLEARAASRVTPSVTSRAAAWWELSPHNARAWDAELVTRYLPPLI